MIGTEVAMRKINVDIGHTAAIGIGMMKATIDADAVETEIMINPEPGMIKIEILGTHGEIVSERIVRVMMTGKGDAATMKTKIDAVAVEMMTYIERGNVDIETTALVITGNVVTHGNDLNPHSLPSFPTYTPYVPVLYSRT